MLLAWHQQFPPDLYEKHRNQAIQEFKAIATHLLIFQRR
nr:hypothetical protein [Virgibacillus alimentarius]